MKNYIFVLGLILLGCNQQTTKEEINYGSFIINKTAETPPMGWNSWDVYGADVTEDEVKEIADYMSANLLKYGYEYVVIDIAWYAPNATAIHEKYKEPYPEQIIDEYGRLLPASNRFPSAKNGSFKPLADYIHGKGLKFGIHVMRGIPRQAVEQNTPIKGTKYFAKDIVMYEKTCTFYDGLLSIDMSKPGAQEYYNSIVELYTDWGVDFIKADDMTSYPHKYDEAKGLRYAIEQSGKPIVLSLSPGAVSSWDRSYLHHYADMYRISGDFWDEWPKLKEMFNKCRIFKGHTGVGGWADCDMIPLGIINTRGERGDGERKTRFTSDEQYTLMTLWSIYRSPLMLGMDLTRLDTFTFNLLTNEKVLEINQTSINNDEIYNLDGIIIWKADSKDGTESYLAVFNTNDNESLIDLTEKLKGKFDFQAFTEFYDVWTGKPISFDDSKTISIVPHGTKYIACKQVGKE